MIRRRVTGSRRRFRMSSRVPSCAQVGMSAAEMVVADAGYGYTSTRHVHAALPRLVDQPKRVNGLAPGRFSDRLVMRDLRRQPALFPDGDRLANAGLDSQLLVAHVGDVDSAHRACHFGELDDLICLAERRGHVEESRAQAEGAVAHALARQRAHALELVCASAHG